MLQTALGVAKDIVCSVEISEIFLGALLLGRVGEFVRMCLGALGEKFPLQRLDVKPRLARFIEQREGVSQSGGFRALSLFRALRFPKT